VYSSLSSPSVIITSQALFSELSSDFSFSTTPKKEREPTTTGNALNSRDFYTPIEQRTRHISGLRENEWGKSERVPDEKIKEFIHLFIFRHPDCKMSFLSHSKGLFPTSNHRSDHFFHNLLCSSTILEESFEKFETPTRSSPAQCISESLQRGSSNEENFQDESLNHSTPSADRITVPHTKKNAHNSKYPRRRRGRTSSGENIDGAGNSLPWKVDRNNPNFTDHRSPKNASGLLSGGKKRDLSFCLDDEYSGEYSLCSSSASDGGSSCPSRSSSAFPFETNSTFCPGSAIRPSSSSSPSVAMETLALSHQQPPSGSIPSPPHKKRSQSLYDGRSKSVPLLLHFESVSDMESHPPPCSLYLPPKKTRGRSSSYTEDVVASLHSLLPLDLLLTLEPSRFAPILSGEAVPSTCGGHCIPSCSQGISSLENILK
jgi:hypothetical protein